MPKFRLPRYCSAIRKPARFRNTNDEITQFPSTPKLYNFYFYNIHKEAFENTMNRLNEHFNQKGFEKYAQLQNVLYLD